MKVLITGFSGFIGSHLTDRLLEDGHEVIGLDRTIKWENLVDPKNPHLTTHEVDILGEIEPLFRGVDIVFHLAALTRPQWSIEHPVESTKVNVEGTVNVLNSCKNNNVKRIVFMSSSAMYGDQKLYPTPEWVVPNPMNPYALSKFVGEQYCKLFETVFKLEWNAIRPFNVYGPRMPLTGVYTSAAATFIDVIKNNKELVMYGDGEQRRDFVYVGDVVEQMILMATSKEHGQAFNCGSGTNNSINELLSFVEEVMGKKLHPKRIKAKFEPGQTLAKINKARDLLGWEPKVKLKEGLRRTVEAL